MITTLQQHVISLLNVAAFISAGMHQKPGDLDLCKEHLGVGCDSLVAAGIHYTEYCEDLFNAADKAGFEVPGVFLYEVAEEFGRWYVSETYMMGKVHPGKLPSHQLVCNHLKNLTWEFFMNGYDKSIAQNFDLAEVLVSVKQPDPVVL